MTTRAGGECIRQQPCLEIRGHTLSWSGGGGCSAASARLLAAAPPRPRSAANASCQLVSRRSSPCCDAAAADGRTWPPPVAAVAAAAVVLCALAAVTAPPHAARPSPAACRCRSANPPVRQRNIMARTNAGCENGGLEMFVQHKLRSALFRSRYPPERVPRVLDEKPCCASSWTHFHPFAKCPREITPLSKIETGRFTNQGHLQQLCRRLPATRRRFPSRRS